MKKTKVAFVCVHNSCRSQIAEALTKKFAGDSIEVYSAGTELKDQINQDAVRLVKEMYNIDMEKTQKPKLIEDIPEVDYLITMGCNVVCPVMPYTVKKDDWGLEDPTGKKDDEFIAVIKTIEKKVINLIEELERRGKY
ncbi:arsenate reductase ArsC [Finegoldia magna]|uniref:Arsenate reductase ArsC n=1 Tax=Finegoldia magna TaxID=1260 RepID=A0A233VFH7_FINMA|nr:arsenate reductase ArsC [Finegoldia magna]MBS5965225.1 arsenate reductase ArsC [Finegoldia magna]OXZ31175.1 low molecular weight phosphatase family protein [Finegoldia magna]